MNRPPPWRCPECGTKSVRPTTIEYRTTMKHENVPHDITVPDLPVNKCDQCGEVSVGVAADDRLNAALGEKLVMLTAESLREGREALRQTQRQFAESFGFAAESVSRWENGAVPSRVANRFIRAYFALPELRVFLADLTVNPNLGSAVTWHVHSDPVRHAYGSDSTSALGAFEWTGTSSLFGTKAGATSTENATEKVMEPECSSLVSREQARAPPTHRIPRHPLSHELQQGPHEHSYAYIQA